MTTRRRIRNLFARPAARPTRRAPHRTRLTLEPLEDRRLLATIVVNNPTDKPAGGQIDLRQAIAQAVSGDTISFNPTVFATLTTITLGGTQLEINKNLTIDGPKAGVVVTGGGKSRVFEVDPGVTATLSGLTITHGSQITVLGYNKIRHDNGGGLYNLGTANLNNVTLSGNYAGTGGGLDNLGTANLNNVTVSGNATEYDRAAG